MAKAARRLLVLSLLLAWPALASARDYPRLNEALVDSQVIPAYAAFAAETAALREETAAACGPQDPERAVRLRAAYHRAADAWQRVQHLRFGPAEFFLRARRIAFWPDPRNRVGTQLRELLQSEDEAAITPEAFAAGSVAVQGLPALELLLFGEGGGGEGEEGPFACRLTVAIGDNLATLAREILAEWRDGPEAYRRAVETAGEESSPYAEPRQATLELFKSLHLAVELVAEHKLARPLGASLEASRPQLAESRTSGRSLRNMVLNLEAARNLYDGGEGWGFDDALRAAGEGETAALFERAFAQTLTTARSLEMPFEAALRAPEARPALERLATETTALETLLARRLSTALDLPLGFNALDGD